MPEFRRGGFRGGGRGGPRRSFGGPREQTEITCSSCGKKDTVPFKPREGTGATLLCKECFLKKKGITPRTSERPVKQKTLREESEGEYGEVEEEPQKVEAEEEEGVTADEEYGSAEEEEFEEEEEE